MTLDAIIASLRPQPHPSDRPRVKAMPQPTPAERILTIARRIAREVAYETGSTVVIYPRHHKRPSNRPSLDRHPIGGRLTLSPMG